MCCYVLSVTEACVPRDVPLMFLEEQHSCKSQEINLFLFVPGVLVLVKYMIGNDNQMELRDSFIYPFVRGV